MYDALYENDSAGYSPDGSTVYVDAGGAVPPVATSARSPLDHSNPIPAAVVPDPPDPALGGKPGMTHALGWSTGMRNSRAFRQAFDGRTLVVPNMGVHPIQGPVGYSSRSDRLVYGVEALQGSKTPDDSQVSQHFADPNAVAISAVTGRNPNYV